MTALSKFYANSVSNSLTDVHLDIHVLKAGIQYGAGHVNNTNITISMYFQMPYSIIKLTTDQVSETHHNIHHSTVLQ